jgi:hypothetical protein
MNNKLIEAFFYKQSLFLDENAETPEGRFVSPYSKERFLENGNHGQKWFRKIKEKLLNELVRVSHGEFVVELLKVVSVFNSLGVKKYSIVNDEEFRKSKRWCFELVKDAFKVKPKSLIYPRVFAYDRSSSDYYIYNAKNYVIIDDGSFRGNQLLGIFAKLNASNKYVYTRRPKKNIYLLIPHIMKDAVESLKEWAEDNKKYWNLTLITFDMKKYNVLEDEIPSNIKTSLDVLTETEKRKVRAFHEKHDVDYEHEKIYDLFYDRPLIYFDHRIPDGNLRGVQDILSKSDRPYKDFDYY